MAKIAALFVVAIAFQCVFAAPKIAKSAPVEEPGSIIVKLFKDISTEIEKHVPDPKHVVENVTGNTKELVTNLEGIVAKWKIEVDKHSDDVSSAGKAVLAKVSAAVENLKKLATPPEGSKAAELKASFDNNLKELTAQGDKLKDDFKPYFDKAKSDITAFGTFLYDGFWSFGKSVQSHVDGIVKTNTAEAA